MRLLSRKNRHACLPMLGEACFYARFFSFSFRIIAAHTSLKGKSLEGKGHYSYLLFEAFFFCFYYVKTTTRLFLIVSLWKTKGKKLLHARKRKEGLDYHPSPDFLFLNKASKAKEKYAQLLVFLPLQGIRA